MTNQPMLPGHPAERLSDIPPAPPVPEPSTDPEASYASRGGHTADASESPTSPAPARGAVQRFWSMRTLIAAAITTVALSGIGGAALASAAAGSDDGDDGFGGRGGLGGPGLGHHGQFPPNGQVPNGQVPNGQVPGLAPRTSEGRDT